MVRDKEEIIYINMIEDFFWASFNFGVSFGEPSEENSYNYEP
jgi:hypothetical protein